VSEKLYKDCPKSYQLLCSKSDKEAIKQAMEQLSEDHPEVFTLDDLYEPTCLFMVGEKGGIYVLKNPGPGVTLLEDQSVEKKLLPKHVYSDVVLRIHLERVQVFVPVGGKGMVELLGDDRRAVVERFKHNPAWLGHVMKSQAEMLSKENRKKNQFEEMVWEANEQR
jgi:hypothetical protein